MWVHGESHVDLEGKTVELWGAAQDITERKRAEEERENLQAQLAQAQKMESVGRLAGGVAHDFNNMLGAILGYTELAMEKLDPAQPLFADLQEVRKAAERSADLTRQLLAFARKQTVAPRVIDLNKTVEGMLNMLRRLIGEDIDLAWLPGKELGPVKMDPSQIDQILANLCVNARDAVEGVGKVTIETGVAAFNEAYCADHAGFVAGDYAMLAVSDNGCGMDQETLGHLFEPFFTTKEVGRGTGLGLAMVYGAVKQNNGFITVYSEPGQGTTFKIYLPRHLAKADRPAERGPGQPVKGGHETILLVEDEPAILDMVTTMIESFGYAVIGARTPGEAIRLAREHAGTIHLLITDVVMPEMNGRDLAGNILSLYPGIKRLFMSGYTANVIAHHGVLDEGVNFIQKPFSMKNLAAKVREALGGR
jgi:signal transduction histidine kinase